MNTVHEPWFEPAMSVAQSHALLIGVFNVTRGLGVRGKWKNGLCTWNDNHQQPVKEVDIYMLFGITDIAAVVLCIITLFK
jgi:hypothetical protein